MAQDGAKAGRLAQEPVSGWGGEGTGGGAEGRRGDAMAVTFTGSYPTFPIPKCPLGFLRLVPAKWPMQVKGDL